MLMWGESLHLTFYFSTIIFPQSLIRQQIFIYIILWGKNGFCSANYDILISWPNVLNPGFYLISIFWGLSSILITIQMFLIVQTSKAGWREKKDSYSSVGLEWISYSWYQKHQASAFPDNGLVLSPSVSNYDKARSKYPTFGFIEHFLSLKCFAGINHIIIKYWYLHD